MYQHYRGALRPSVFARLLLFVPFRSNCVIKNDDAIGANISLHELGSFAVEVLTNCGIIIPLFEVGVELAQHKALSIERERFHAIPTIMDGHLVRIVTW